MHTPAAALTWELWRRHSKRLITLIVLFLAFALVYPKLCAWAGVNLDADALDEFAKKFAVLPGRGSRDIAQILYMLFLAGGPAGILFLSLIYVTWMSTFTEVDASTKDPMKFPTRLFSLPISTSFLFGWLVTLGMGIVIMLYESWLHLVRLPHVAIFAAYQNCFAWMTLVALTQGITWALAGWPFLRMFLLMALLFAFSFSPIQQEIFESPAVLPSCFVAGLVLGRLGLQKMRHGQWQAFSGDWIVARTFGRGQLRGPERFASAAQAQLWFEWRRFARGLCLCVAGLVVAPVIVCLLVRFITGPGSIQEETVMILLSYPIYLVAMPVVMHLCFALSPPLSDQSFRMNRPLTDGDLTMATIKAAGISLTISWMVVFVAMCGVPFLGGFKMLEETVSISTGRKAAIVIGLIFITWRLIVVNLCFLWSGKRWMQRVPLLTLLAIYAGLVAGMILNHDIELWPLFLRYISVLLICLVMAKIILAVLAFRISLARRLLSPTAFFRYLGVWAILTVALMATLLFLAEPPAGQMLPLVLSVILVVPLARVGFCPIALSWSRHG